MLDGRCGDLAALYPSHFEGVADMRYIILWALGVPVLALVALHLLGIL
jgi:hypothetical protein